MRVYKFLDAKFGMKSLAEKRLKISTVDDLNDPFELLPFGIADKTKRMAVNNARKIWGASHGMLCFSSDWSDPVIWAHYSDKHRGICLGFEIPDVYGTKVNYIDDRLPLPDRLQLGDAAAWVITKFTNWSYEKEIRLFTTLKETNFLLVRPIRKFSDDPGCSVAELQSVRQWQTIIDVIDFGAVHVWDLKTKANSAMFIAVMRPNNRVAPVGTKAKHAVRGAPNFPSVIHCHPFRFVCNTE